MKGEVVAGTNCSKENSSSIRQTISGRVVKHWIEGGEMTEKLWTCPGFGDAKFSSGQSPKHLYI